MDDIKWLSDSPIIFSEGDLLNFDNAAGILEKMISECDTPFSIGINGYWGSGKTSFMRLIKEKIDTKYSSNIIRTSWFDTWNYTNEEEIWKILMISLIDDLDPENKNEIDVKKLIFSVLNLGLIASKAYISNGTSLYDDKSGFLSSLEGIMKSKKNREESIIRNKIKSIKSFRSNLEELVDKCLEENGKYVIFIDDLDRISPEKSMDVIESIKIFLSCEKCVFIIGCDYNYLNECFETKYEGMKFCGKDYMEKIVQITFNVPTLNVHNFNFFLNSYLKSLFFTKEDIQTASYLIGKSLGKNPRKVKRLINLYSVVHSLNDKGLDNCLLLKLLCFMERWPEYHKKFLEDFHEGIYTYKKYERWALPLESFEEFVGYDPSDDFDDSYIEPSSIEYEYDEYASEKKSIDSEVDEELKSGVKNSEEKMLKNFLSTPPLLPSRIDKFAPYISLVGSIDLASVKTREEDAINTLPSVKNIDERVHELIELFDGQKVVGEYFNFEGQIFLPNKEKIQKSDKGKTQRSRRLSEDFTIEGWKYVILKQKLDDKQHLDYINKYKKDPSDFLWIISPWTFPKSVREYTKTRRDIYLTSYYSLESLLEELKKDKIYAFEMRNQ
jgi:hypothetical protein